MYVMQPHVVNPYSRLWIYFEGGVEQDRLVHMCSMILFCNVRYSFIDFCQHYPHLVSFKSLQNDRISTCPNGRHIQIFVKLNVIRLFEFTPRREKLVEKRRKYWLSTFSVFFSKISLILQIVLFLEAF